MGSIREFLAMGGYAVYVWPALGLTVVVMTGLAIHAWRGLRREEIAVKQLEDALQARDAEAGDADISA